MSDETYRSNEGWASEPGTTSAADSSAAASNAAGERVGFCQDCGRPLTAEMVRSVGTGVFCEPCLAVRVGTTPPGAAGYTTVPPYTAGPAATGTGYAGTGYAGGPQTAVLGEASPVLAGFLGLIPGVGAMYNGQFAKGVVHLIVFAVLVSLSNHVSDVFGIFVFGWVCYQIFDAYHTAKARVAGMPLPNPFGFNDVGERMGFTKNWPGANTTWSSVPPASPGATPDGQAAPPYVGATPAAGSDWVGYVPPTAFAGAPPVAPGEPVLGAHHSAAWGHAAYAETYSGGMGMPYAAAPVTATPMPYVPVPAVPARKFPVGAIWLIALGVLILLANLVPEWEINGRWFPPVLFAGLAVYVFTRRMRRGVRLVCILRAPVILMTLAIMFAFHAAYYEVNFALTGAVLLIVIGALMVLERTVGVGPGYTVAPPIAEPIAEQRASFTSTGPVVHEPSKVVGDMGNEIPKDGQ